MLWVAEHGRIFKGASNLILPHGNLQLGRDDFESMKSLLDESSETDLSAVLKFSMLHGQDCLVVQNYTGVVRTSTECQIEILPKVSKSHGQREARETLVKMLIELEDSPFKEGVVADLKAHEMPLFELIMRQFLKHVSDIVRKGIARTYVEHQDNLLFLRGKLQLPEHIKRNTTIRNRVYCEFDEYEVDRPINRLIKGALKVVQRESKSSVSKQLCRECLIWFDRVPATIDPPSDFRSVRRDRNIQHYQPAMPTCRLILEGLNPLTQSGENRAVSMMFDMNRVFEDYVAAKLVEQFPNWKIYTQVQEHSVIEKHAGKSAFGLRPDLELVNAHSRIVADTKWKLIDQNERSTNYGILQGDVYQLFAYTKKHLECQPVKRVFLIYPRTDEFAAPLDPFWFRESDEVLYVVPYDLEADKLIPPADIVPDLNGIASNSRNAA